jgi:hypothetical protein
LFRSNFFFALAGLDPAIHVFFSDAASKDVNPRVKPGGGENFPVRTPC